MLKLAYCDYIAEMIKLAFTNDKPDNLIQKVDPVKWDLHPEKGYFVSTKKTVFMEDVNGKKYKVTVEECE